MIVYIDGSASKTMVAAGMVALVDEHMYEQTASTLHVQTQCELFALTETCKLTDDLRVAYKDTSVYSDCMLTSSLQFIMHNGSSMKKKKAIGYLEKACVASALPVDTILKFINEARLNHVKGHSSYVYNMRAHYLAISRVRGKIPLGYDEWLKHGVSTHDFQWWAPFVANLPKLPV